MRRKVLIRNVFFLAGLDEVSACHGLCCIPLVGVMLDHNTFSEMGSVVFIVLLFVAGVIGMCHIDRNKVRTTF